MSICFSCFDECYDIPQPCDCERICGKCTENFESEIDDDDIPLDMNDDFQKFFIDSVDWKKKNAGFLEELGISDPGLLPAQVLKILRVSPNRLLEIFEEALATETETVKIFDETPVDGSLFPSINFDSAIKFLMKFFISVCHSNFDFANYKDRFQQLLESHVMPEAVMTEDIENNDFE